MFHIPPPRQFRHLVELDTSTLQRIVAEFTNAYKHLMIAHREGCNTPEQFAWRLVNAYPNLSFDKAKDIAADLICCGEKQSLKAIA